MKGDPPACSTCKYFCDGDGYKCRHPKLEEFSPIYGRQWVSAREMREERDVVALANGRCGWEGRLHEEATGWSPSVALVMVGMALFILGAFFLRVG